MRFRLTRPSAVQYEDSALYPARLSELARALKGIPWLLAGGLTIPLRLGRFYRTHCDLDLAFPAEEFPRVSQAMSDAGFFLSTHFPLSFFGAMRFAVNIPVSHDGWLAQRRPRKFRFFDESGARAAPHLLSGIDAFPYRIEDGCFTTCDGRYRFPLDRPLVGHTYRTPDGYDIACLDLHFVTRIKRRLDDPKHALDLSMVARHFPSHVGAEGD